MVGLFHAPSSMWVVNISAGFVCLDPDPGKIQAALKFPSKSLEVYSVLNQFRRRADYSVKRIPTGPITLGEQI